MKRILFLLLLSVTCFGQTYQNPTYGTVKLKTNSVTVSTNKIISQDSDGSLNTINAANLPINFATLDSLSHKQNLATGFAQGLALSINTDPTKFNVAPGFYVIVNYPPLSQPVVKVIQYAGSTGNTTPYLNSSPSTYVGINEAGTLVMQTTPFTNTQRRTICILGNVVHSNLSTINVVNEIKAPIIAPVNQLHDLIRAIGAFNIRGNVFGANGGNMKMDKTAGEAFALGINAQDYKNPHVLSLGAQTALTFRYRNQNSLEGGDITDIDPNTYDVSGTTTAVPSNKFTIQRINLFQSGAVRVQRGQNLYNSLSEALAGFPTAPFVTEPNIADNSIFRAYLVVRQGVTNLTTAIALGNAQFVAVDKFGNTVSGGSIALTASNIISALGFTPENVANKSDSYTVSSSTTYASTKALVDGLASKLNASEKGAVNGVATLNGSGKIPNTQIPAIAISETFVVASQAAMLAISGAEQGDVAVRTDINKSFILTNTPASTLSNWQELLTPTDAVSSVNGQTGAVSLTTLHIPESTNLYFTQARVSSNPDVLANSNSRHTALTLGTTNGLSLTGLSQQLSLGLSSSSTTGALSSTDWNTFNSKQNALTNPITGTGTSGYLSKFTGAGTLGNSLTYDNGTNVGIGTTSPNENLTVASTNVITNLRVGNNATTNGVGLSWDNSSGIGRLQTVGNAWHIRIGAGNNDHLNIISNGNVGIGHTNPSQKLTVDGNYLFTGDQRFIDWNNGDSRIGAINNGANRELYFGTYNTTTGYAERMRISGLGKVGVGTTDPIAKLHANAQTQTDSPNRAFAGAFLTGSDVGVAFGQYAVAGGYSAWMQACRDSDNASFNLTIQPNGGGVGIGQINPEEKLHVNGNFKITGNIISAGSVTATAFYATSDIRLKELVDYKFDVSTIKPITYRWKDTTKDQKIHVGYSAQEVEKVLPDAVSTDKEGYKSVDYIQVLVAKVAELEKRISELEKAKK